MVDKVFLSLGSNKGDRLSYLRNAVQRIAADESNKVLAVSPVYETLPYGIKEQDNFLNAVIEIDTGYGVVHLFNYLKNIETEIGRTKNEIKWGPREIDIDIVFFNALIYETDELTVPHPEVMKRDFILIPLLDIAGDYFYPGTKSKIKLTDVSKLETYIIEKTNYKLIDN